VEAGSVSLLTDDCVPEVCWTINNDAGPVGLELKVGSLTCVKLNYIIIIVYHYH